MVLTGDRSGPSALDEKRQQWGAYLTDMSVRSCSFDGIDKVAALPIIQETPIHLEA